MGESACCRGAGLVGRNSDREIIFVVAKRWHGSVYADLNEVLLHEWNYVEFESDCLKIVNLVNE